MDNQEIRIIIAGDSLPLPRLLPEIVDCENVWPTLFEKQLCKSGVKARVISHARRERTLPRLLMEYDDIAGLWKPDAVIIQVGIVDCAPRLFSPLQHTLLNNRWFYWRIARMIIRTASRFRRQIIMLRPWVRYTSPRHFRKTLDRLAEKTLSSQIIIVLPILKTFPSHEHRSPGYNRVVERYNAMWEEWCRTVGAIWVKHDTLKGDHSMEDLLLSDGHHLSIKGHRRVSSVLAGIFLERFS